jgi:transposase-like protein
LLGNNHCKSPRVINTDKAKAFPPAFEEAQAEGIIPKKTKHRSQKYMNNIQEQDHRPTKRRVRQSQWFQSFHTAKWTIDGYESMHMLRKGQVKRLASEDVRANVDFIENLFGIAA